MKGPELLEYVQAPYPEQAQADGREGVVLLLIEIDEAGDVSTSKSCSLPEKTLMQPLWSCLELYLLAREDARGTHPVQLTKRLCLGCFRSRRGRRRWQAKEEVILPINLDGVLLEMGTKRPLANFPIKATMSGMRVSRQRQTTTVDMNFVPIRSGWLR